MKTKKNSPTTKGNKKKAHRQPKPTKKHKVILKRKRQKKATIDFIENALVIFSETFGCMTLILIATTPITRLNIQEILNIATLVSLFVAPVCLLSTIEKENQK